MNAPVADRDSRSHVSLNGTWQLTFGRQASSADSLPEPKAPPGFATIPATVPGNVELDLIAAGRLPANLDYADNIYLLRAYEAHQWWYRHTFTAPTGPGRPVLVFDGIDTLATIWLNGQRLGTAANMLIPHEFALDGLLREGENTLTVAINSAVLRGRELPVDPGTHAHENNWESIRIRKAPSMYGWDIMPRVVSAGLWKDVRIEYRPEIRFDDVYLATLSVDPAKRSARLLVHWSFTEPADAFMPSRDLRLRVFDRATGQLAHESHTVVLATKGQIHETIADIDLWYPKGYGRPTLYDVELALVEEGRVVADWRSAFGFRTIALRNSEVVTPDGDGEFQFVVNGVDIFCKGSNWVPLDALHSRDDARLDDTLALLGDLNCNMIRCWGGNVYEGQRFFDFCDREGVMVWQDFSLACAIYPQTDAFHAEMRAEAEAIVPLLRNHPSLAIWAGNNEIDQFYPWAKPGVDPNVDDMISRRVLPDACRRLDPLRLYLPSSPYYSSKLWATGNVRAAAEDHLWGPRDDFKGRFYTGSTARFASEIGYHGCPARSSLERMMRPEQLWPWQGSEDWLTHAVRPQPESTRYNYRIPLMAGQIGVLFGDVPSELDDFVLASQLSQAEALKFFIEKFRIEKGRRSGILWWNIKDGWPQISDAIVDYYGSRKLAYHIVRRLQADVLVMASEPSGGRHRLVAVNDTAKDVAIDLEVSVAGTSAFAARGRLVPANGRVDLGEIDERGEFTVFDIAWSGEHATGSNHYLGGPRPFDLKALIALYRRILGDQPVDEQIASLGAAKR